jgi:glycosyltransferase involved in cell wall biosynthesis
MRLGILATHPIQYHAPLYRALAERIDLQVYFAHQQTAEGQAKAGFGVAFEWDVPLLEGYPHEFLTNTAASPDVSTFWGCSTPEISDIIAQEQFDAFLVNGWYNRSFWQAMRACWRTSTPLFVRGDSQLGTPRSLPLRLAKEAAYRAFIPRFDAYLVVGERSREYYRYYGARSDRMFFVPHFVDNAAFELAAAEIYFQRDAYRTERTISPHVPVALFVGKFIDVKRPLDFVRGVASLAERIPGLEGVMVGAGPLQPDIEAEVERLEAPVHLLGFMNQSDIPKAYALADILVLPSTTETWGLVVNEAMACGLPAVVSDEVGCAADLIDPGATGETYPMGDVDALVMALERALQIAGAPGTPQALAEKMRLYSLDTAVDGILAALKQRARSPRMPVS